MHTPRPLVLSFALVLVAGCGKHEAAPIAAPPAARTTTPAPAATTAAAPAAKPAKETVFATAELDQMVAPIALYPDPLLAQVLMAATYPGDVADAVAWSKLHLDAKGDAAVQAVASQPWDPSVQSLVAFPQALATLGQDPAWVQRLGDAFLAQPDDVMDAVQRLRRQAQKTGNLQSNQYQIVTTGPAPAPATAPAMGADTTPMAQASTPPIIIAPVDPQVVYVPSYNPTTVYGDWAYPAYPPVYYPPSSLWYPGRALGAGLAFGAGIAISDALWGDCDWGRGDVDINVNHYNNINTSRQISSSQRNWQHDPLHRDGVPYRDQAHREQFDRRLPGAESREGFRGEDAQRAQARAQARTSMEQRGIERPGSASRDARERVADVDRAQANERARASQRNTAAMRDGQRASQRAGDVASGQRVQPFRTEGPSTSQARERAQRQQGGGARNNAFQGAGSPSQARAQAQRGQASHAQARASSGGGRGGGGRSGGQQVNRPAPAPRSSGGARPSSGGGRHR